MEYSDLGSGPQPLSLTVAIYDKAEVDLMGALETLVSHFDNLPTEAKRRAVDWLHAKYGSGEVGNGC